MPKTANPVDLVGCGYTELTRRPAASDEDLVVAACRQAAEDAGVPVEDIDGINIQIHHYPPVDTAAVVRRLGLRDVRWSSDGGLGVRALADAARALDSGVCDMVLVCKVMNTIAPVSTPVMDPETGEVPGPDQFDIPYGLGYTMQRVGLVMRRWMHRFAITPEQIGWVAVTERQNALRNPHAYFKEGMTLDDYLGSRMVADPVRLLDCDYPVNGAFAYLMGRADRVAGSRHRPVRLAAWTGPAGRGGAVRPHLQPEVLDDLAPLVDEMYRDAGMGPADLDVWCLYDGFSFFVLQWMEFLRLVGPGEAGAYVAGGTRIAHGSAHPLNPHGGQLSEGRMHASGHILEAVQQVRGTAGARQLPGAGSAIVSSALPGAGAAAILVAA
jgi:acetyl-CoA acetyltransferase